MKILQFVPDPFADEFSSLLYELTILWTARGQRQPNTCASTAAYAARVPPTLLPSAPEGTAVLSFLGHHLKTKLKAFFFCFF